MRARDLAVIIANISTIATAFGQIAMSPRTIDGKDVVMLAAEDVMNSSKRLAEYCNQLGELIPNVEIRVRGGNDASHRNDKR